MTDDLVARLRFYANPLNREAADALEEITDSREAVWKHAKTLEKDLLAHKDRIWELESALKLMIDTQDDWEKSVAKVIGKQPNVFSRAIDAARAAYMGEKDVPS